MPHSQQDDCPARRSTCNNCGKSGHWERVCKSKQMSEISEEDWKRDLTIILDNLTSAQYEKMKECLTDFPEVQKAGRSREKMPGKIIQLYGTEKSILEMERVMQEIPRMDNRIQKWLKPYVEKVRSKPEKQQDDQLERSQPVKKLKTRDSQDGKALWEKSIFDLKSSGILETEAIWLKNPSCSHMTKTKKGKFCFYLGVADETASVKLMVYGKDLHRRIKEGSSYIFRELIQDGKYVKVNASSSVSETKPVNVPEEFEREAERLVYPESPLTSIKDVKSSPPQTHVSVEGTVTEIYPVQKVKVEHKEKKTNQQKFKLSQEAEEISVTMWDEATSRAKTFHSETEVSLNSTKFTKITKVQSVGIRKVTLKIRGIKKATLKETQLEVDLDTKLQTFCMSEISEEDWKRDLTIILEDLTSAQYEKMKECLRGFTQVKKSGRSREKMPGKIIQLYGTEKSILEMERVMQEIPRMDNRIQKWLKPYVEKDGQYELNSQPTGLCLIINNGHFGDGNVRHGTDKDAESLAEVFSSLGFRVLMCTDQTKDQMERALECFASQCDLSQLQEFKVKEWTRSGFTDLLEAPQHGDAFICCVLSHGSKGGVLGIDGQSLPIKQIERTFMETPQSPLTAKPKVFLIQTCQGRLIHPGVLLNDLQADGSHSIPKEADFLVHSSTVEDYYSIRSPTEGSWFIQSVCEQLKVGCLRNEEIEVILRRVNNEVAGKEGDLRRGPVKQMPEMRHTLRKGLVLTPHQNSGGGILPRLDAAVQQPLKEIKELKKLLKKNKDYSAPTKHALTCRCSLRVVLRKFTERLLSDGTGFKTVEEFNKGFFHMLPLTMSEISEEEEEKSDHHPGSGSITVLKAGRSREKMPGKIIQLYGTEKSILEMERVMQEIPRMDNRIQKWLKPYVEKKLKTRDSQDGKALWEKSIFDLKSSGILETEAIVGKVVKKSKLLTYDTKIKKGKFCFYLGVADETASVKLMVYGKDLHRRIKEGSSYIFRELIHDGKYVKVNASSSVSETKPVNVPEEFEREAERLVYPESPLTSIKDIKSSPPQTHVSVEGTVTQIYPVQKVKVEHKEKKTNQQKFKLSQEAEEISVTMWDEATKQSKDLSVGDVLLLTNMKPHEYFREVSSTQLNSPKSPRYLQLPVTQVQSVGIRKVTLKIRGIKKATLKETQLEVDLDTKLQTFCVASRLLAKTLDFQLKKGFDKDLLKRIPLSMSEISEEDWKRDLTIILEDLTSAQYEKMKECLRGFTQVKKSGRSREKMPGKIIQLYGTEKSILEMERVMQEIPRMDNRIQKWLKPYVEKDGQYELNSQPTGLCLIINNGHFGDGNVRHGTDKDAAWQRCSARWGSEC
ncbi:hypothetical protein F7725_006391 [Dissostichus mawsoni]|uniref:Uncharacterized protein n=1 Tax=Dissostichus mawsoni TaxID=36200 RepID=A0A7J5XVL1_DISMA|nr:hypothetical protein F7725_006391 [Dissostichus mawsoni]